ncbi:PQ loop repeat-domain-containing protein [Cubamyces lactineus]|nr:PQ loop repeat-domain-containing protein [Cubamyces lactineus]
MVLSASFSDLLGYTSIACWLGAQFPQVLENARRQSVEGLALPFLMNWLLGDATNLLGCILTNQLPFQTYLATYFVFVDFSLLSQYFYYRTPTEKTMRPPYLHSRDRTASVATRRLSLDRGAGAPHYRALSTVAANVAAVAALAAQQEGHARWHHGRSHSSEPHPTSYEDEDEVSDEALARLAESFHSEGGRSSRRKHVAWRQESFQGGSRHSTLPSPPARMHSSLHIAFPSQATEEVAEVTARGRPLVRAADLVDEDEEEWLSANAHRRSSRASRKGATMVFLGVWALFGVGAFTGGRKAPSSAIAEHTGQVLARADVPVAAIAEAAPGLPFVDPVLSAQLSGDPSIFHDLATTSTTEYSTFDEPRPTTEHIIGRISAWVCTTLYLTSRLPQIWKNYVRKSVEGLSIYLFIFAFLGNFFYVASILTSPNLQLPEPEAAAFIRQSIPYLLGSGGTLMFDVTIVAQSLIYRPKALSRGRRTSRTYSEEEAGLLDAARTCPEGSPVASRRRTGSVSREL